MSPLRNPITVGVLATALMLGTLGCGSDDDEAAVESTTPTSPATSPGDTATTAPSGDPAEWACADEDKIFRMVDPGGDGAETPEDALERYVTNDGADDHEPFEAFTMTGETDTQATFVALDDSGAVTEEVVTDFLEMEDSPGWWVTSSAACQA